MRAELLQHHGPQLRQRLGRHTPPAQARVRPERDGSPGADDADRDKQQQRQIDPHPILPAAKPLQFHEDVDRREQEEDVEIPVPQAGGADGQHRDQGAERADQDQGTQHMADGGLFGTCVPCTLAPVPGQEGEPGQTEERQQIAHPGADEGIQHLGPSGRGTARHHIGGRGHHILLEQVKSQHIQADGDRCDQQGDRDAWA